MHIVARYRVPHCCNAYCDSVAAQQQAEGEYDSSLADRKLRVISIPHSCDVLLNDWVLSENNIEVARENFVDVVVITPATGC